MPKYLLQLRKTSFFLIFRSSDISFGSNKASSTAEATWHPMPPLKSLSDALSLKGSPPCMGARSQACESGGWVSDLSMPCCDAWLTFCCFAARWASSSWVGWDLPVSTTSFSFCSLFLFGSAGSGLIGWGGWGVGGGDLGREGGIWDYVDFPCDAPIWLIVWCVWVCDECGCVMSVGVWWVPHQIFTGLN